MTQRYMTDFFKFKSSQSRPIKCFKGSREFLKHRREQFAATRKYGEYIYCASDDCTDYSVYTAKDKYVPTENGDDRCIHAGTKVATAMVDDTSALEHIHVESNFRRQGIGKNLIRFINKCDKKFIVFGGVEHNSRY